MKAHWTASDFRNMLRKPLAYTPDDIELIERGLAARAALNSEVKNDSQSDVACRVRAPHCAKVRQYPCRTICAFFCSSLVGVGR